jgi:surface protein
VASADVSALQNEEKEPYVVLSDNNTVLTFYYDDQKAARNGMGVGPFTESYDKDRQRFIVNTGWYEQRENIINVVFDESFANCTTLTSTAYWFYNLENLSSITGISNLKTDNVTNMQEMFYCCSSLTSLDVTGFKTDNVTDMQNMFHSCFRLKSLDVSNFKTDNVTDMNTMFTSCAGLKSIDVSGFKTDNVTRMYGMFSNCTGLTSLDVSNFKTDNVTDMSAMFSICRSLTSLDLSNFKTDKVRAMERMFEGSYRLNTIYTGDGWSTANTAKGAGGKDMFKDCTSLVGGAGTTYSADHTDHTYAHIDGGASNPGYFTDKNATNQENVDDATNNDKTKRTIHVETAGTLPDLISADDKYLIEELTLTGNLNGTDIFLIRAMAGVNLDYMKTEYAPAYGGAKTNGNLKVLDLSDVNIVEGGRDYYRMMLSSSEDWFGYSKYTQANTISDCMFADCWVLEELILPRSVTTISSPCADIYAYGPILINIKKLKVAEGNPNYISPNDCNAIIEKETKTLIAGCATTVIPEDVSSIGANAFRDNEGLTSITIPSSVTTIGQGAFEQCSGLTSVEIPNSVTSIGSSAFYKCSGLTSVTISNSVTSIGSSAFSGCSKLTSVTIPNGVNSIEEYTFAGCSDLVSVTIPNSVTSIGIRAFNSCSALTSLEIPNSVTSIDNFAFDGCSGLTSISIPSSVTSINRYAFDCSGLESVTSLATTPPQAEETAFTKFDIPLYVPKGTRDAYLAASPWNKFKEIVELGNTSDDTDVDEITIKDIGKTTWCSEYDLDFTNVAGIKAYTATGYDNVDKTIWLTRVMKVPAGTGILVKGDAGIYKIPHAKVQSAYANWFVGNLGATISIAATDGDKTNYYLSGKDGSFVSVNGSANIGTNKAYLQLPTSVFAGTRSIGISYDDEDGTTSIRDLTPALSEGEGAWYTLQGQRVAKPGKGLYIRNGKKVVIR